MSDPTPDGSPYCGALAELAVVLRSQARRLRVEAARLDRIARDARAAVAFYREQERLDRLERGLAGPPAQS